MILLPDVEPTIYTLVTLRRERDIGRMEPVDLRYQCDCIAIVIDDIVRCGETLLSGHLRCHDGADLLLR